MRPSGIARALNCSYSATIPDTGESSEAAEEGSAAHRLAEHWLKGGDPNDLIGEPYITPEMVEYVHTYVEYCQSLQERGATWIECKLSNIFDVMEGTADFVFVDDVNRTIEIVDLKYGYKWVEPYMNPQLTCYVDGFKPHGNVNINLTIVQPRVYHPQGSIRTWHTSTADTAYQDTRDQIIATTWAVQSGNVTASAGSHCEYCPGRFTCKTFDAAVNAGLDYVSELGLNDEYSPDQLSTYYRSLEQVEDLLSIKKKVLQSQMESALSKGVKVDGYQMQQTFSNSKWKVSLEELKSLTEIDVVKETLITPAEAKRRGMDAETIKELTERVPTGNKIKRVDTRLAAQLFSRK